MQPNKTEKLPTTVQELIESGYDSEKYQLNYHHGSDLITFVPRCTAHIEPYKRTPLISERISMVELYSVDCKQQHATTFELLGYLFCIMFVGFLSFTVISLIILLLNH